MGVTGFAADMVMKTNKEVPPCLSLSMPSSLLCYLLLSQREQVEASQGQLKVLIHKRARGNMKCIIRQKLGARVIGVVLVVVGYTL